MKHSGKKNPTVRDFMEVSARGTNAGHTVFCGTPQLVADAMEAWFTGPACGGVVPAATHVPGAVEDVTRVLVAEPQRRGLLQTDYHDPMLRENLGLSIPRESDWQVGRRAAQ